MFSFNTSIACANGSKPMMDAFGYSVLKYRMEAPMLLPQSMINGLFFLIGCKEIFTVHKDFVKQVSEGIKIDKVEAVSEDVYRGGGFGIEIAALQVFALYRGIGMCKFTPGDARAVAFVYAPNLSDQVQPVYEKGYAPLQNSSGLPPQNNVFTRQLDRSTTKPFDQ
jgi:hypothetical protein